MAAENHTEFSEKQNQLQMTDTKQHLFPLDCTIQGCNFFHCLK